MRGQSGGTFESRLNAVLEYTTVAATTLKEIASAGKIPVLSITATAGLAIAQALQTSKTNREHVLVLLERTHKILCCVIELYTVVDEESGLSPSMLFDIAKFTDTLQKIVSLLNEQQGMGRLKQFFKQNEQTTQLEACKAELKSSLELFSAHCVRMNVTNIARVEMQSQEYHEQLLALLAEHPALTNSDLSSTTSNTEWMKTSSALSLSMLPSLPQIFHGREPELNHIISTLQQTNAARVAVLGTGGMGKTTLVAAVLNHPETASLFPGNQLYFVPCHSASNADELLANIASHIGIERHSRVKRVLQCLDYAKTLLVLDNFETPWEAPEERVEVEKLLGQLAELEKLSIIITMRGAERPTGVQWTRPFLPPLAPISDDAALQTFLDIADDDEQSTAVNDLLECTGNLPLAITLISSAAADEGAEATLARWRQTKTLVLSDGYDKRSSLDISISLSLTSPRMTEEALELLSLLAILPDGLADAELIQALGDVIPSVLSVKAVLLRTTLAFINQASRRLQLLLPVREYIAQSYPPPPNLQDAIWVYLVKLLELWNDFEHMQISPRIVQQISANMQTLRNLIMRQLEDEEDKGTTREKEALMAAMGVEAFLSVANMPTAVPWDKILPERVKPWKHDHAVYGAYLKKTVGDQKPSDFDIEAIIIEGNEYFVGQPPSERARWYSEVAGYYQVCRTDFKKAIEYRYLAIDADPSPLAWRYYTAISHDLMMTDDARKAYKVALRAYECALQLSPVVSPNNNGPLAMTLSVLGRCAMGIGDYAKASRYLEDSLAFFEGSEMFGLQPHVKAVSVLSVLHGLKTEYAEARKVVRDSIAPTDPRHPPSLSHIFTDMNIAISDIDLAGDAVAIEKRLEEMRKHLETATVAPIGFLFLDMIYGELRMYQGNLPEARRLLKQSFFQLTGTSNEVAVSCAQRFADIDTQLSGIEDAFRWSMVLLAFAGKIGDKLEQLLALRCLGKVWLADGDGNERDGEVLLELVLEDLTFMDVHRWRAECMVWLATRVPGTIQRRSAEEREDLLKGAIPEFERSGQTRDVEKVRALLLELGQ